MKDVPFQGQRVNVGGESLQPQKTPPPQQPSLLSPVITSDNEGPAWENQYQNPTGELCILLFSTLLSY